MKLQISFFLLLTSLITYATDYHVGSSQPHAIIFEVSLTTLNAGDCHYTSSNLNNQGNNLKGSSLLFEDILNQVFDLQDNYLLINIRDEIPSVLLLGYTISFEYIKYQYLINKPISGSLDKVAFGYNQNSSTNNEILNNSISNYPKLTSKTFIISLKEIFLESIVIYNELE